MNEETIRDAAFELCRDRHRRLLLSILLADERPMTMNDLTKEIAVRVHGEQITDLSAEVVVGTYCLLYHVHVPKLADAKVLTHDHERNLVETGDAFAAMKPFVSQFVDDHRTPPVASSD